MGVFINIRNTLTQNKNYCREKHREVQLFLISEKKCYVWTLSNWLGIIKIKREMAKTSLWKKEKYLKWMIHKKKIQEMSMRAFFSKVDHTLTSII